MFKYFCEKLYAMNLELITFFYLLLRIITIFTYPFSSGSRYMPLMVRPKEMLVLLLVLRNPLFCRPSHYPRYYCQISQKTTLKLKEMEIYFYTLIHELKSYSWLICTFTVFWQTINQFLKLLSFEKKTENYKEYRKKNVARLLCSYDNISGEGFA